MNVLIATFSVWKNKKRTAINGMIEPLLSYFLPKEHSVHLIDGPHPESSTVITRFEIYEKGIKKQTDTSYTSLIFYPILRLNNYHATQLSFKIRDFFACLEWIFRNKTPYELFIGLESVYTCAGVLLRKMGRVKKVVYYVSDYSPKRYLNRFLNNAYLALDRFCCYHADVIWDVSPAIHPARVKAGLEKSRSAPVIHVPNALFPEQITQTHEKTQPYSLVFTGTLGEENGPDLAIDALPTILKKFPNTRLHIIGGGEKNILRLKELAKKRSVSQQVIFHGFFSDAIKASEVTKQFMIGLAPYRAIPYSPRWYADATKIRLYMGLGIPVITTHVPPLGREIVKLKAGLSVQDAAQELSKGILTLFSNKKLYEEMRKNAMNFAIQNTWENTYSTALKKMHLL